MGNAINRGQRLGAALVNKMAQTATGAAQLRINGGRGSGGPLGSTVSMPRAPSANDNIIAAVATRTQLAFTVVELQGAKDMDGFLPIPIARLPVRWAASRVGILLDHAVPGQIVPVQIAGVCLLRYDTADPDLDVQPGDRLTARKDYFWPTKCSGGPFLVLAIGEQDPAWLAYNYALVEITRKRANHVFMRDTYDPPRVEGAFEVLVVAPDLSVREVQPGVAEIT